MAQLWPYQIKKNLKNSKIILYKKPLRLLNSVNSALEENQQISTQ